MLIISLPDFCLHQNVILFVVLMCSSELIAVEWPDKIIKFLLINLTIIV